jgi:hypothetical protein
MALARDLGLSPAAAAGGGLAYALGGFSLSSLNLYVYLQAVAWAPLVVMGLGRAAERRPLGLAMGAIFTAVALSTTGVEIVLQAVFAAVVLSLRWSEPRRALRLAVSLSLALGLAAPTIAVMTSLVGGSARSGGFPLDVVLAQSVHPLTLVQVVVGNLLADLSDLTNRWWGMNFFPLGFPYMLSLYLGPALLSLAGLGILDGGSLGRRAALLAFVGTFICVGRWAGLAAIVELVPFANRFRHPSKAFFTAHLAVAILAALALDRLGRVGSERSWRRFGPVAFGVGACLVSLLAVPAVLPGPTRWFFDGFLPPSSTPQFRHDVAAFIVGDAATGGFLAIAAAGVALLVVQRYLSAPAGALALVAFVASDLLRTGAGLNPMAAPSYFRLSPEMAATAVTMRAEGGRVFSCDPTSGPEYFRGRLARASAHDAWTFAVYMETLVPYFNMGARVPSALSRDLTMLVPLERVLAHEEAGSSSVPSNLGRLRRAGVHHVLSLEKIDHPELRLEALVTPSRIAPLTLHHYALRDTLPLRQLAVDAVPAADRSTAEALVADGRLQASGGAAIEGVTEPVVGASGRIVSASDSADSVLLEVEADRSTVVIWRDAFAPGWTAQVNGVHAPVLRADGRHRAVPIPAGRSTVTLRYRPPRLSSALVVSALSLALIALAWRKRF